MVACSRARSFLVGVLKYQQHGYCISGAEGGFEVG